MIEWAKVYCNLRNIVVTVAFVLLAFWTVYSYCRTIDIDFRTPEMDQMEEHACDNQGLDAYDRYMSESDDPRDREAFMDFVEKNYS